MINSITDPQIQILDVSGVSKYENHIVQNTINKSNLNFIKLNIFPDGGISRFRIYGRAIS
jgi:allantoicase